MARQSFCICLRLLGGYPAPFMAFDASAYSFAHNFLVQLYFKGSWPGSLYSNSFFIFFIFSTQHHVIFYTIRSTTEQDLFGGISHFLDSKNTFFFKKAQIIKSVAQKQYLLRMMNNCACTVYVASISSCFYKDTWIVLSWLHFAFLSRPICATSVSESTHKSLQHEVISCCCCTDVLTADGGCIVYSDQPNWKIIHINKYELNYFKHAHQLDGFCFLLSESEMLCWSLRGEFGLRDTCSL